MQMKCTRLEILSKHNLHCFCSLLFCSCFHFFGCRLSLRSASGFTVHRGNPISLLPVLLISLCVVNAAKYVSVFNIGLQNTFVYCWNSVSVERRLQGAWWRAARLRLQLDDLLLSAHDPGQQSGRASRG